MIGTTISNGFRVVFGRIVQISPDTKLQAGIGAVPYDLIVSFGPRLLEGYEGQDLARLGVQVGAAVKLKVNVKSGEVCAAQVL
jgi:hypothetical protein